WQAPGEVGEHDVLDVAVRVARRVPDPPARTAREVCDRTCGTPIGQRGLADLVDLDRLALGREHAAIARGNQLVSPARRITGAFVERDAADLAEMIVRDAIADECVAA